MPTVSPPISTTSRPCSGISELFPATWRVLESICTTSLYGQKNSAGDLPRRCKRRNRREITSRGNGLRPGIARGGLGAKLVLLDFHGGHAVFVAHKAPTR